MWALNEGDMHFVSVHILKLMSSFGPPGNHIQGNILHTPGQLIPKPAQSTSSHVHQQTELGLFQSLFLQVNILKDERRNLSHSCDKFRLSSFKMFTWRNKDWKWKQMKADLVILLFEPFSNKIASLFILYFLYYSYIRDSS